MTKKIREPSSLPMVGLLVVLIAIAAVFGFFILKKEKTEPADQPQKTAPQTAKVPIKDRPVIDYQDLDKNETLQSEMQRRKAEYGVKDGVDFIVKPGESIKIGDLTVPMAEILEKIRLEKGEIIENDLTPPPAIEKLRQEKLVRIQDLSRAEKRYETLDRMLKNPEIQEETEQHQTLAKEHADLAGSVALFKKYKKTLAEIEKSHRRMKQGSAEDREAARTRFHTLISELQKLEKLLGIPSIPEKKSEAYGIYIVRPGDNIWNIHFRFLRDYFAHRNIELSPGADEPNARGFSSGVGKILKFSENMVYIYNLREKRLDVNLNLLQPLSKIVIFNMGEVFSVLDPIDYGKVNKIRFDGETLWIPAEQ